MIAQRDSQVMTGLGHAARLDSGAMKTIAVVTMAFLPPTFLSARDPLRPINDLYLTRAGDLQHEFFQLHP